MSCLLRNGEKINIESHNLPMLDEFVKNYIEYYQVKERFRCMKIEHVVMYFNDLEEGKRFLCKVLCWKKQMMKLS